MFNKSRSHKKDSNSSSKSPESKNVSVKHDQNPVEKRSKILNSVPVDNRRYQNESSIPQLKIKSPRESHSSVIHTPVSVRSLPSGNHVLNRINSSMNFSITSDRSTTEDVLERIKKDVQELRSQYLSDLKCVQRESRDIQENMKNMKREIYDYMHDRTEAIRTSVDQLDVRVEMQSKSIFNVQSHYSKFVSFVLEHMLLMIKNQEYLMNRMNELERPHSHTNKLLESSGSSYCNTPSSKSCPYTISISSSTDKNYCHLVFTPVDQICISKFSDEVHEQIYSLPVIQNVSQSHIHHSMSAPNGHNSVHRKVVLGSKTIPYYLKRVNNTDQDRTTSSSCSNNQRKDVYQNDHEGAFSNGNNKEMRTLSRKSSFKDLKRRYLKLKLNGLNGYGTYPCVNTPTLESEGSYQVEDDADSSVETSDCVRCLCQSDTDIFVDKFNSLSSDVFPESGECYKIPEKTIIYQQLTSSFLQQLRNAQRIQQDNQNCNNCGNNSTKMSIFLPRSQLSSLLSNNFTNIPSVLLLSEAGNEEETTKSTTLKELPMKSIVPGGIDYFPLPSKKSLKPMANLASVETLSDNDNYMDDDYCHQSLIDQQAQPSMNSFSSINDSYDQLYSNLHHFSLPRSSATDILKLLKK